MKKNLLTLLFIAVSICTVVAQVPKAFKYQAVVRDINGISIADQSINLRISIIPGNPEGEPVYTEIHQAVTNGMGLVNLEIGRGNNPTGEFSAINWSQGEFYIKMEMDEKGGSDFKAIGVAQLLSVPYALHSGTAESVSGPDRNGDDPGVPSYNWSLFGNSESNPPVDKLGTTDNKYLSVVTNNIERMKIGEGGDIDIWKSLTVGENLTVNNNVTLNALHSGGVTINRGPFTVSDVSPTLLSGTLTVDGATNLNSSLDVYGITNLHSNFNVLEEAPSYMTGVLTVDKDATFNKHVYLNDETLNSTSVNTGALVVKGGVGIGKNLYVGGNAVFNGPLAVTDATESTSTTTGALTVVGGVGIGKRLNVGGATALGASLSVNGQVNITSNLTTAPENTFNSYPMMIQGGQHGIAIKVNGSRTSDNNYISFWDTESGGKMHGRIEGQSAANLHSDPQYILEYSLKATDVALYLAESIIGALETGQGVVKLTAAGTSSTACAGLGACITAPIPSLIVESSTNLVLKIANAVVFVANVAAKSADLIQYVAFKEAQVGISYQSGAGDYAEWLPKGNPSDIFMSGDLVGLRNGIITRDLASAEKIMVVSTNPIVLGNMPPEGMENNFVKIAFMGQVPVKVLGKVNPGDYILPSELGGGFGKAVSPDLMKLRDYKSIVGVAWNNIVPITTGASMVNVAVGINSNDLTTEIYKQEEKYNSLLKEHEALKAEVEKSIAVLADLIPGYADAVGYVPAQKSGNNQQPSKEIVHNDDVILDSDPEEVVYFEISREQVESSLDIARENYTQMLENKDQLTKILVAGNELRTNDKGIVLMPIEEHPFWKRIDSDPEYRNEIVNYIKDNLEKSYYTQRKYLSNFTGMKIKE